LGLQAYASLLKDFASSPKPIVARVAGHCVGGGLGLMLSCDMVYVADSAKIGTPEVSVGLFPMMVTAILPRHTSRKRVLEMVFTGRLVSAKEAEQMGLVTRVCEADALDQVVEGVLADLVAKAPLAVSLGRRAFLATDDMSFAAGLDYLCGQLEVLAKTEDAAEGFAAFQQKRAPLWKGR
jgi:enoyl-CoA hydratase/carnithine racemase